MKLKENIKGCWTIISVLLGIIIIVIIVLAIMGTIGDLMFDFVNQRK